ncbi:uncharacterized protein BO95DRAFT_466734 [Aspergillus brunneoviolaceus CBS 621.78]|uniref:Uncharacterized protein n=1 Tax=Aspergillus brunneoviolaceus CBS 621.78 TaxID=1450534 RepID=A0ACD1G040_9EURO|nr:hypothetical protein BO95DRAFT_466734 [Aspergillus brunneoviolaceus CBS 621.78]RAH42626.1 hypothetical protein BO95DRAFT_466734 [Aspergillus brunneoviolaceus CBS 621.78]
MVFANDRKTVLSWDSWQHMCSNLENPIGNPPPIHAATFASPVIQLTSEFAALTEAGEVFQWGDELLEQPPAVPDDDEGFGQAEFAAHPETARLQAAQTAPSAHQRAIYGSRLCYCDHTHWRPLCDGFETRALPDIKDANPRKALEFQPATIPPDKLAKTHSLRMKHAAAGGRHVVAVATDGSLWSAGDGLSGQLGIGVRQFGLCTADGVVDMGANETEEKFAVKWERMEVEALRDRECVAVFANEQQTFNFTRNPD